MSANTKTLDPLAIIILLVLCASWGFQQVVVKLTNPGVSPILQAGIRSIGATVLVSAWILTRKKSIFDRDGTLWWGIAAGLLFAGEFLLIFWGLSFTHASRAVIFLYLSPFVVALGAQLFIPGENLRVIQTMGLCSAFAGIVLAFSESVGHPSQHMLIGDVMLVGAAVLWGATTVLVKASPLATVDPAKTLLYQLGVSAVVLPVGSMAFHEPGIIQMTPFIAACLAFQIVWIASVTYLAWFWLIKNYPASRVASFSFFTPIFGVIAGAILLREPIGFRLLLALVLVAGGIYLVNRPTRRENPVSRHRHRGTVSDR